MTAKRVLTPSPMGTSDRHKEGQAFTLRLSAELETWIRGEVEKWSGRGEKPTKSGLISTALAIYRDILEALGPEWFDVLKEAHSQNSTEGKVIAILVKESLASGKKTKRLDR